MQKLTRADLYSLEDYAATRAEFRARVMSHKAHRRVDLGDHLSLFFEDRLTMLYQIQEMLRAERIFEADATQEELDAYNPLIPDGNNLKATMMLQYENVDERHAALAELLDIEQKVWLKVGEHDPITPICDEDLERTTDAKTSSVHFLRFELTSAMAASLKDGARLTIGVDHPRYQYTQDPVAGEIAAALAADLD